MFDIEGIDKLKNTVSRAKTGATANIQKHWTDYALLFIIILLLGAFDSVIVRRSDNLGSFNYWAHAFTRLSAFVIATVLGIRIGYPKFKANCKELQDALEYNSKLLPLRETDFEDYINAVNIETKKHAWKSKINRKLAKLDKRSPAVFSLYYLSKDKDGKRSEDYFAKVKPLWAKKKIIDKANKYCEKRETLENLLKDEYIDENLHILNVKYPVIHKQDFDYVEGIKDEGYSAYHTQANTRTAKMRSVKDSVMFTFIAVMVGGLIAFDINEALAQQQISALFSAIIGSLFDIGMTIWKATSGYFSCEKIVRSEDLRAVVDRNSLLILYCESKGKEYPKQAGVENEKTSA